MPDCTAILADALRNERAGALDRALELYRAVAEEADDADTRAQARTHEADVLRARCDWDAALAAARAARDIAERAKLVDRIADAIIAEANVLISTGNFSGAI